MVVGKTNPQALARSAITPTPKLPPLPKLRVRRPDTVEPNPCIGVMSSVLGCWASQGYSAEGCAALEQSLRACMDAKVSRIRLREAG
nr:37s ribosomal protein mrp10, mitochondrial [Quercus suber]